MASQNVVEITDANYQTTALGSPVPVLLDFWAAWCAPCRATAPHVDALADQYAGKVRVGKIDADGNQEVSAHFDIRSLPTFLAIKNGQVVGQIVGAVSRAKLDDLIQKALAA